MSANSLQSEGTKLILKALENHPSLQWIDLHANPVFEEFVNWLRDQVDHLAARGDQALNDRMTSRFLRMVDLEVAFFDAAYTG